MTAKTSQEITSGTLTTCGVVKEGRGIRLEFLDPAGEPFSVEFPLEQAHSIIMTLPRLLTQALKRQTSDPTARYVFSLDRWTLESTKGETVIASLATEGGFAVSFSIPPDVCKALGFALRQEGLSAGTQSDSAHAGDPTVLN